MQSLPKAQFILSASPPAFGRRADFLKTRLEIYTARPEPEEPMAWERYLNCLHRRGRGGRGRSQTSTASFRNGAGGTFQSQNSGATRKARSTGITISAGDRDGI